MDTVLRSLFVYTFLIIILRISGKRTLSEATTFDFVLLLIIGESTQQALLGDDFSLTNAGIVITTLLLIDIILASIKHRFKLFDGVLEGKPLVLMDKGKLLTKRMAKEKIDKEDILEAARKMQGIGRLDQIEYAVLEKTGGITIIPKKQNQ